MHTIVRSGPGTSTWTVLFVGAHGAGPVFKDLELAVAAEICSFLNGGPIPQHGDAIKLLYREL